MQRLVPAAAVHLCLLKQGNPERQAASICHPVLPGLAAKESEGEEAAEARVALAQDMGRGNLASRHSRVRLQEVCSHPA